MAIVFDGEEGELRRELEMLQVEDRAIDREMSALLARRSRVLERMDQVRRALWESVCSAMREPKWKAPY